jgi:hypothetical protein
MSHPFDDNMLVFSAVKSIGISHNCFTGKKHVIIAFPIRSFQKHTSKFVIQSPLSVSERTR